MKKIAIFVSGSGTNMENLILKIREQQLPYEPALVICDKPGAKALERAARLKVKTELVERKQFVSKEMFEKTIIEKFIKEEPRITPSRSTFYSPVNRAKESIVDHDDVVSETLARIHAQQGNYEKAISVYGKLSLLHPEKSAYFAALIMELKQKQNT